MPESATARAAAAHHRHHKRAVAAINEVVARAEANPAKRPWLADDVLEELVRLGWQAP